MKTKIIADPKLQQPTLRRNKVGFTITLPVPLFLTEDEEEGISFLGYRFTADVAGKSKVGRLFRACIFHLTAHTLMKDGYQLSLEPKLGTAEAFSEALACDTYVNTLIRLLHPEAIPDISYANAFAFERMKPVEKIFNPSTRMMAALMSRINIGFLKGKLPSEEDKIVGKLALKLDDLKEKIMPSTGEAAFVGEGLSETAVEITEVLESHGPILEVPSLQYTENIGPCTIYNRKTPSESEIEGTFRKSLAALSRKALLECPMEACWKKETNAEAQQAFDSWFHQRDRERKILEKLVKYVSLTKLKSVKFPDEDYTQYIRARTLLRGGSRRLLDSLRVAQDALDEDPGKEYGQLDLTAIVQMLAAGKARTDVFLRDEYLSRSFAWGVLLDVSASMKIKGNLGRALAICVAEATKELLMDPGSWSFFAFSDHFYVLKDASEAYSHRVRARIGGLKFEGLTFMPDALQVAGAILSKRLGEQRFLIVLSDGWPYGYPDMSSALSETISVLNRKNVIVIGVGLESERMGNFFRINCRVNNQKDLIKKFAKIYVNASTAALE